MLVVSWFVIPSCSGKAKSVPLDLYPYGLIAYTQGKKLVSTGRYQHRYYRTQMSKGYVKSVNAHEYQAINFYRTHEEPGSHSLKKNHNLEKLADWRAYQASKHFTHYHRGQVIVWRDAQRMHLGNQNWLRHNLGENMCLVGRLNHVRENYRDAYYYFSRPSTLANCNVFDLVNNDAAAHYAHGMNIMNKHNRYLGVGTYFNRSKRRLYILSEFSVHKPVINSNHK